MVSNDDSGFDYFVRERQSDLKRITDQHTQNHNVIFAVEKCGICMHVMGRQKLQRPLNNQGPQAVGGSL